MSGEQVTLDVTGEVPEEWARIGFSGLFAVIADVSLQTAEAYQKMLTRLPCFLDGSADQVMVLREHEPGSVVLVYKDWTAFAMVMSTPQKATP